jgi:general secretion pathway protein G
MHTAHRLRPHHAAMRGFTIVELMFVILIIAILGGVVAFNFGGIAERAKVETTKTSMATIKGALAQYRTQYNSYPPTALGVQILVVEKIFDKELIDSWGVPFDYYSPTINDPNGFALISYGPDKMPNSADDITLTSDPQ